jgi:hypothetical protein
MVNETTDGRLNLLRVALLASPDKSGRPLCINYQPLTINHQLANSKLVFNFFSFSNRSIAS